MVMIASFEAIPRFASFPGEIPRLGLQSYVFILKLLLPFLLLLAVISIISNIVQFGPLWSRKAGKPNFGRMFNPAALKKFFSTGPMVAVPKNTLKMIVVGVMAYLVVSKHYREFLLLADQSPGQIVEFLFDVSRELLLKCAALLILIGVADFIYNKRQYRKQLMMTKHEVKDEMKAAEGDPRIKGKIKTLRREMLQRILANELPKATVVITNPTFIAIALRYEQGQDQAPVVLAKGKRLLAERIRDTAKSHGVPIVEDKPLARGLYEVAEVGEVIPTEFFAAVAEILAAVISLKRPQTAETRV
jgi:flagellar biosynthetic protein FlhB